MKTWQKTLIMSSVALSACSADKDFRAIVTDRADNKIVYRPIVRDNRDAEYVMVFDMGVNGADLYEFISVGDTISGATLFNRPVTRCQELGGNIISTINGVSPVSLRRQKMARGHMVPSAHLRDSLIREIRSNHK